MRNRRYGSSKGPPQRYAEMPIKHGRVSQAMNKHAERSMVRYSKRIIRVHLGRM
jgi:hypothetical protein